ncbi:type II secretion system protein GspK [Methylosinus sp. PW1]|uniref:type II secretion system protein GspK n=1 Tax=Methylosinus sp. PW1 TaxID=107636 RepID=UPI0005668820|nr:type II secretion system protein GspK [Methylosinus sp. PW1]
MTHGRKIAERKGFALLIVIFGLGVIILLMTSFMATARLRLRSAVDNSASIKTRLIAEGAVNLAIFGLIAEQRPSNAQQAEPPVYDGSPRLCSFAGAAVAISIEDESGKLDLNAASPQLLEAALRGFGAADPSALSRAIIAFREAQTSEFARLAAPPPSSDRPFAPKHAPFQTALELDQVEGMEPQLLRALLPVVTIHSHSVGVDARAAPPALFAALARYSATDVLALSAKPFPNSLDRRDPRFPQEYRQNGVFGGGTYSIHAEAALLNGAIGVVEMVVTLRSNERLPFTVLETRRAPARNQSLLGAGGAAAPC